jgi:hypothetical protein
MAIFYNPRTVTNGLVLALDAANPKSYPGTGTTWTDLSGNGNNGTLVNGVGYSGDNLGSLSFDGVNDYVDLGTSIQNYSVFTTSFWINYNVFSSSHRSPLGDDSAAFSYHILFLNGDIYLSFSPTFQFVVVNHGTINTNIWYNFAVTKDSSNNVVFYKNGVSLGGGNQSGTININKIGRGYVYDNANISNVGFYNRALTPQEIQQNFNATKSRFL